MPGCVTCHTCHASVTHFRPISGNIVEVTLMTSPKHVYNSHAKETVERMQPGAILVHNPAIAKHNTSALLLATEVCSPFCYTQCISHL